MKNKIYFIVFIIIISLNNHGYCESEKPIIISGKVSNHQHNNREIKIFASRLGFNSLDLSTELDSLGNFYAVFESYIPTNISIRYNNFFYILVNPGDSINIALDGNTNQDFDFYNSIKMSGDNAITNQNVIEFQKRYFTSSDYLDRDSKEKAIKELDSIQYQDYLDDAQQKRNDLYEDFIKSIPHDQVSVDWAKYYIEQEYYNELFFYPMLHASYNGQPTDSYQVPVGYFDKITNSLPLTESKFICGFTLSDFIDNYFSYISEKCWAEKENQKYKEKGRYISGPVEIMDSIDVYSIFKYTSDTLLRQILLTKKFSDDIQNYSIVEPFEKYQNIVERYINLPYLKKYLYEQYARLKERLENPQYIADIMTETTAYSTQQLIDSILKANTGKIIYIDCWATWCGPCKAEMPNSKILMNEMKDRNVAFVYLCLDSKEKIWKENLAKLNISGQHLLLNEQQGNDFKKALNIQGVPFYILLNKDGKIVDKGSHLRPHVVKDQIEELLNE